MHSSLNQWYQEQQVLPETSQAVKIWQLVIFACGMQKASMLVRWQIRTFWVGRMRCACSNDVYSSHTKQVSSSFSFWFSLFWESLTWVAQRINSTWPCVCFKWHLSAFHSNRMWTPACPTTLS